MRFNHINHISVYTGKIIFAMVHQLGLEKIHYLAKHEII